jgi:hypothetical protein
MIKILFAAIISVRSTVNTFMRKGNDPDSGSVLMTNGSGSVRPKNIEDPDTEHLYPVVGIFPSHVRISTMDICE